MNDELQNMNEDWVECTLGEVFFTTSGGTPSRRNKGFYDGKIPWVKSGELDKGIINKTEENISEDAVKKSSAKIFPKGTLLIALYGATIGKLAFLGVDATTNQAICGIYKNDNINHNFLFYYLFFRKPTLISKGSGGAQPNISQSILKKLLFPIAPLPIQRAIVAKIEALFSDLDNGIANLKKAQEQLKIYRQAVLKKAFEGELTKDWREEIVKTDVVETHGRASQRATQLTSQRADLLPTAEELLEQIKEERQKHYEKQIEDWKKAVKEWEKNGKEGKKPTKPKKLKELTPLTDDELNELPKLPDGWIWEKNENYLFEVKDGTHDTPKYYSEGIPFITQKNIKNNTIDFSDVKYISEKKHNDFYKRSNVTFGDIIIAMIGHNRGNCCLVNTHNTFSIKNVGLFKFFKHLQSNKFALYYYQSTLGRNIILKTSKGGAQSFIGLTELRNWCFPVCSLSEQTQIVQEIETRLSVCDKVEQSIIESLEKAESLRQSILKKAFEGQLLSEAEVKACKQEPDYEPASVLLARIERSRNEKIKAEKVKTQGRASQRTSKKSRKNGKLKR